MQQSNLHVAIIMDGNGRWATGRGLPRAAGHQQGAEALRRIVEAAPACGVDILTVYAFSSDNWKRPPLEVETLMALLGWYLENETPRCLANGVQMTIIGRRDRLPDSLVELIDAAERTTRACSRLNLRIAIDYSARDAILSASRRAAGGATDAAALRGTARRDEVGRCSDPDGRRTAAQRLPALGMRVRGTGVHESDVAGLQPCRSGARGP